MAKAYPHALTLFPAIKWFAVADADHWYG